VLDIRRNPRLLYIPELGLSRKVTILLIKDSIYTIHDLIMIVIYTRGDLLEIEGLEEKDKDEIVRKIHDFLDSKDNQE
jgi:hypothetical protein